MTIRNPLHNSELCLLSLQDNLECIKSSAESSRVKNSLCLSSFLSIPYFVDDRGGTPPPNDDIKKNLRSDAFLTYHKLKHYRLFSDKDKGECFDSLHRPVPGVGLTLARHPSSCSYDFNPSPFLHLSQVR